MEWSSPQYSSCVGESGFCLLPVQKDNNLLRLTNIYLHPRALLTKNPKPLDRIMLVSVATAIADVFEKINIP